MKTSKLHLTAALISAPLLLASCATMKNGSTQEMHFDSNPEGVIVKGDKGEIGVTPFTTDLKRNSSGSFLFEKPGYDTDVIFVKKKFNQSTLANFLLLPLWPVGYFVDGVTGGAYRFANDNVYMELQPIDNNDELSAELQAIGTDEIEFSPESQTVVAAT